MSDSRHLHWGAEALWLPLLSLRFWIFFAAFYGLTGTILHLLGLNHTRLTYYNNGIERRLTDVHGHVIEPILA